MAFADRIEIIKEIEELRGSHVLCYLTSVRAGVGAQMAEDAVRVMFDHLLLLPEKPVDKLDLFICSNGGNSVVPWRIISLLREYAKKIGVLIPFRAYSAATMLALGADEIVMHPFAEMGPIDPTVSNEYNPVDPHTRRRIGISVEDVKAYVSFVKDTVGIRHEDELVKAIEILARKVHPLAIGNVERFIAQSRMIARKILSTHMSEDSAHKIDKIIDTLASKLYFHGHPINRKEAREELGLQVTENVPPALETAMWKLYLDFEREMKNNEALDLVGDMYRQLPDPVPIPAGQQGVPPIVPIGSSARTQDVVAFVESTRISSAFERDLRLVVVGVGNQGEPVVRNEALAQGWKVHQAPQPAPAVQPIETAQPDVPAG